MTPSSVTSPGFFTKARLIHAACIGGVLLAMLAWTGFALLVLMPLLYGPYAMAFADAGPLFIGRLGGMISFMVMPILCLSIPLAVATSVWRWLVAQTLALICGALCLASYGYYLHHIVALQGVEASLEYLAAEVGFQSAAAVPQHIKDAFALSARLVEQDAAPWQPGAWRAITWPEIPAHAAKAGRP